MKLSQDNLIKLGLGGAAGYIGAKMLLPHRGFAKHGSSCGNPNKCNGQSCCNIGCDELVTCQIPCGWNPSTFARLTQNCGGAGGEVSRLISGQQDNEGGSPGGFDPNQHPGGGIGFPDLSGIPGTIFGIATPIVIVGGLVALIILTRK